MKQAVLILVKILAGGGAVDVFAHLFHQIFAHKAGDVNVCGKDLIVVKSHAFTHDVFTFLHIGGDVLILRFGKVCRGFGDHVGAAFQNEAAGLTRITHGVVRLQNIASGDVFRIVFIIPPFTGDGLVPVVKGQSGGELVQAFFTSQRIGLFGQLFQVREVHVFRGDPLVQLIYAFKTVVDVQIDPDAGHAAGSCKFSHFIGNTVPEKGEIAGRDQGIIRRLPGHAGKSDGILQRDVIRFFLLFPACVSTPFDFLQTSGIDGFPVAA